MSLTTIQTAPVQERIETRRTLRNLENFLDFRFGEKKKLTLVETKVHGYAVQCLNEINEQDINWKSYPSLWWNDHLSLRKISQYVAEKATVWSEALQHDAPKLVALERQCALLERVVDKHNQKNAINIPLDNPISFINPFKKVLRIVSSYPATIGQPTKASIIQDISYDRLMPSAELLRRVKEIIDTPITILVPGMTSLQDNKKIECPVSTPPQHLFKQMSQQPEFLFDPSDDNLRESHQIIQMSYDNPDIQVLAALLFKAGQNQALPQVYEQGFAAGKNAGFIEAIKKVEAVFAGK